MNEPEEVVVEPVARPAPKLVWPSVVTLLLGLMGALFLGCFFGQFFLPHDGSAPDLQQLLRDPGLMVVMMGLTQGALFVAVRKLPALLDDVDEGGWRERVQWRPARLSLIDVALGTVGAVAAGTVVLTLVSRDRVPGLALEAVNSASSASGDWLFFWLLLVGALAPGFVEELAFRGLLQSRLVERYGPVVGIGLAAALFGAWHLDPRQGLAAAVLGVWFGWLAWRQNSIVNVALAHALNNSLALSLAHVGGLPGATLTRELRLVVWLTVLAGCALVLQRRTRPAVTRG